MLSAETCETKCQNNFYFRFCTLNEMKLTSARSHRKRNEKHYFISVDIVGYSNPRILEHKRKHQYCNKFYQLFKFVILILFFKILLSHTIYPSILLIHRSDRNWHSKDSQMKYLTHSNYTLKHSNQLLLNFYRQNNLSIFIFF